MGIYDREYYREEPRGFFLGGDRTMVVNLIIINVAIFIVDVLLFNGDLSGILALRPDLFQKPWQVWQLLTYGFAHSRDDALHVACNMLFLWMCGREVEHIYGRRVFLNFYLTVIILAGLIWVVLEQSMALRGVLGELNVPLVGASGAVLGVLMVFAIHYPMRPIYVFGIIPVPVWVLVAFFIVYDFIGLRDQMRGQFDFVAHSVHLAGDAMGALFYKTGWTLGSLLPEKLFRKGFRPRPRLRVHSPEQDDNTLDARVDQILDKINREGESSLTKEERRTLEEASRRYQKRRS